MDRYSTQTAMVGDTVTFPWIDPEDLPELAPGSMKPTYTVTGTVLEIDVERDEVFVSEPGNGGAEGWVAAGSCTLA